MVNDLQQSNIRILDDNKPPERIVQFAPQSKLPLRLALLVDTSGSVVDRFSFEKRAAEKFVEKMLNGSSDLGFIEGFSHETTVTQDFTAGSWRIWERELRSSRTAAGPPFLTRCRSPAGNWLRIPSTSEWREFS